MSSQSTLLQLPPRIVPLFVHDHRRGLNPARGLGLGGGKDRRIDFHFPWFCMNWDE